MGVERARIEINREPNLYGNTKQFLTSNFPSLYLLLRRIKDQALVTVIPPQTEIKTAANIQFLMKFRGPKERAIAAGPAYEERFIGEMLDFIEPGDTIWDIGAAIGTHAIPAAIKTGTEGEVYAFEPDDACRKTLVENLRLNKLTDICILSTALWNKDTELIVHTSGKQGDAAQVTEKGQTPPKNFKNHLKITARSLVSLVNEKTIKPPDVVKIDVEGAGLQVLLGMEDLRPRNIFIEVHPRYGESGEKISELLKNRGYRLVSEDRRGSQSHLHFEINTP